jgi:hypothetical protein
MQSILNFQIRRRRNASSAISSTLHCLQKQPFFNSASGSDFLLVVAFPQVSAKKT